MSQGETNLNISCVSSFFSSLVEKARGTRTRCYHNSIIINRKLFFNTTVDRVFWGVCCERIISVHISWCRFFILLLIIYSGFHTEPWAVIFSDNAWQRQQNILKKQARQPACITRSFNSNSKANSLCSWKFAFFRFQNIILSLLFFFLSWILAQLIIKVFIVFYFYAVFERFYLNSNAV